MRNILVSYRLEPSRCQRLVIAFPPDSPGAEIFCVAGSVRSVYRNLSREHGGPERIPGVVKRFKPTKCRGYQFVLQCIGKQ